MADGRASSSWTVSGFACLAALSLGGCGVVRGAAELTDLATKPGEPKPFVTETRPQDPKYIPIGTTVSRDARRKTVEEFKGLEADLDARRISNEAAGTQAKELGSTPPPAPATLPKD
jgi:hypothetical protein